MTHLLAALLCFLLPASLVAGEGGKKKGHKSKDDPTIEVSVHFSARQRDLVRGYFVETHGRGSCPPGLAKKGNGCLPPGQAKKRYLVGRPLPANVLVAPCPAAITVQIGDPPPGYRYGIVDGDLVKLAIGTLLVVDAIEGLVE
jgi:hypothetical protein